VTVGKNRVVKGMKKLKRRGRSETCLRHLGERKIESSKKKKSVGEGENGLKRKRTDSAGKASRLLPNKFWKKPSFKWGKKKKHDGSKDVTNIDARKPPLRGKKNEQHIHRKEGCVGMPGKSPRETESQCAPRS